MVTAPVPEIKRRGLGAFDADLAEGPVCLIRNNRPAYVVLTFDAYREMEADATLMRVSASESDIAAGRVRRGSAKDLMDELSGE